MLCRQEIPRIFVEQYGSLIKDVVTVVMPDKRTFALAYCTELSYFYGVEQIVKTYSINAHDIMIFTYVAESTFEVSVYKGNGMDLFCKNWNFHSSNHVSKGAVPTNCDESSRLGNGKYSKISLSYNYSYHRFEDCISYMKEIYIY